MTHRLILLPLAAILTSACATVPAVRSDGSSVVRLGQTANLGGPQVTVLKVLEDSRCPIEVDCFWAGRVLLSVRIKLGSGTSTYQLGSNQPLQIADGVLELVETRPAFSNKRTLAPQDYRFAIKFSGGL